MAYICYKPHGSCSSCKHYRFDEDYMGMACFAQQDEKKEEKEWNTNQKKTKK